MRTLRTAYRVLDLGRSLDFYDAFGFHEIGRVATGGDSLLVMLKLPDDDMVTLELVYNPEAGHLDVGNGFRQIVVQVNDIEATLAALADAGIRSEDPQWPAGTDGPRTSMLRDPDGYRIELVQWPRGHADGMTEADFR